MNLRKNFALACTLLLALMVALPAVADYKITRSDTAVVGDKAQDPVEQVIYLSDHGMLIKTSEDTAILYNAKEDEIYFLLTGNKQYMKMDWAKVAAQKEAYSKLIDSMTFTFKDTKRKEKVGEWNTNVWEMIVEGSFGKSEMKFYECPDLKTSPAIEKATDKFTAMNPFSKPEMVTEMKKMKGFPVKTVITQETPGGSSEVTQLVTKIEEKDLKPDMFELHKKFKEIDFDYVKFNKIQAAANKK
ncbi:MAG: DUF4412 domain-containing protein [Acidobacteria bacterium]|nr:DUF4412 domain-containing protein [Acidobacteriota bacterium]